MIPKKKRMTKDVFLSVMKEGKILSSPLFLLRFFNYGGPKYACVVPKSVEKMATKRNSLRRKGYNALRVAQPLPHFTGIFFFKKGSEKANPLEIKDQIQGLLNKIR